MATDWKRYRLGDITEWKSGGTPSKSREEFWGGDIPWISAVSMEGNRYRDSKLHVTDLGLSSGTRLAPAGCLLLLVRGSILHQKIQIGIAERDVAFNQDVKALRVKPDIVEPWYLLFWFMSKQQELLALVENTGIGAGKLDTKILQDLVVEIPPPKERHRIISFLKALDDKIELNRQMNATLESMAQALFKSWFVDFDPVIDNALAAGNSIPEPLQARADRRAALGDKRRPLPQAIQQEFPGSFVFTEEMGWVPRGWGTMPVYDVAKFINGAAFKSSHFDAGDGSLPIVKIAEIKNGITSQTKFTSQQFDGKYHIESGEILFSWSGNPDTSIDTFIWADGPGWLNQHIFKVSLNSVNDRAFVYYLLKHLKPKFTEIARDKQTTGLGHVTAGDMKKLNIIAPDTAALEAFAENALPIMEKCFESIVQTKHLAKLRDTLLPKLLSGQIRIPTAEKRLAEAI